MVDTAAHQLGTLLGNAINQQQNTAANVYPNDPTMAAYINPQEILTITMQGTITLLYYASSSFVLDHPVQGSLDSAVYALDGGYNTSLTTTQTF